MKKNEEYCACGSRVPEFSVWKEIISKWNEGRILDLEQYGQILEMLLGKANVISTHELQKNLWVHLIHVLTEATLF